MRLTRFALIALCVLLVVAGGLFVANQIVAARAEADDVAFNAELWRDATRKREQKGEVPRDTRLNMYRDLMGRDLIFGKTKKEIIELLGEPENCPYLDWPWKHFNYWVGQEDGLVRWNGLWMGIYFDKLDRVQQVEILKSDRERFLNL